MRIENPEYAMIPINPSVAGARLRYAGVVFDRREPARTTEEVIARLSEIEGFPPVDIEVAERIALVFQQIDEEPHNFNDPTQNASLAMSRGKNVSKP